jgi:protocatechuate 3,4-dioxygenase beta subunit
MEERITRKGSLVRMGGFVTALAAGGWKLASQDDAEGAGPAGVASGAVTCVLTPEQTEGPFYIPRERVRRNIREGKRGVPLTLRVVVVNAATCKPIKGAAVDIWHCDAAGAYSGVAAQRNRTFLRGIQRTNAQGLAVFQTIYPGYYPGRTVHIHVKVHLAGNVIHTGQLYFSDAVTDAVFRRTPYSSRPRRRTRNANDSVYRNGGRRSLLRLRKTRTGYLGTITMGVQR